jgi:NAD dependent epimerase/dehydratase family enzyme
LCSSCLEFGQKKSDDDFPYLQVCREWEAKAQTLDKSIRLVRIRIGIVLDKDGGALGMTFSFFLTLKSVFMLVLVRGEYGDSPLPRDRIVH